jgi:hypothetical protein
MPASRSAVSVLLRKLGDFSLHPQGRPAGGRLRRPSSAATDQEEWIDTRPSQAEHHAANLGCISPERVK